MADLRSKLADALINYVEMPGRQLNAFFGAKPKANPLAAARALTQVGGNILGGMKSAYTAPGRALSGELDTNSPEGMQEAMNFAMNVGTGGMGSTAIKPVEGGAGTLGMFIGKKSKSWNPEKEQIFLDLEKQGVHPSEIWSQTGTLRAPDRQLRQETSDNLMKAQIPLNEWVNRQDGQFMAPNIGTAYGKARETLTAQAPTRFKRLYEHEQLNKAYPYGFTPGEQYTSIVDMPLALHEAESTSAGSWGDNLLGVHPSLMPKPAAETFLHELQHAIQSHEGFAPGANIEKEMDLIHEGMLNNIIKNNPNISYMDAIKMLPTKDAIREIATKNYNRSAGEVEAELARTRMNMTPEERLANYPYENVNMKKIIVRGRD